MERKKTPRHAAMDEAKALLAEWIATGAATSRVGSGGPVRAHQCGDDPRVVQVEFVLRYSDSHGEHAEYVQLEITMREIQG